LSVVDDWLMWRLRTSNHQTRLTDFAVTRAATQMPMVFDNASNISKSRFGRVPLAAVKSRMIGGLGRTVTFKGL